MLYIIILVTSVFCFNTCAMIESLSNLAVSQLAQSIKLEVKNEILHTILDCIWINSEPEQVFRKKLIEYYLHILLDIFNQEKYIELKHDNTINSVTFSSNNRYILTGSSDNTARLWDIDELLQDNYQYINLQNPTPVNSVMFSLNNKYALARGTGLTVRLWDLTKDPIIFQDLIGHTDNISSLKFSSDGTHIITGSLDRTVRLWNIERLFQEEYQPIVLEHTNPVISVSCALDTSSILAGLSTRHLSDSIAVLWNLTDNQIVYRLLEIQEGSSMVSTALSYNGKYALTFSDNCEIRLWVLNRDPTLSQVIQMQLNKKEPYPIFSINSRYILTGSDDYSAKLWDLNNLSQENFKPIVLEGHQQSVISLGFSSNEKYAITGSGDNTARVWALYDDKIVSRVLNGHIGCVTSVALSSDGKYALTGSYDNTARLWILDFSYLTTAQLFFAIKLFYLKKNNHSYDEITQDQRFKDALQDQFYKQSIEQYFDLAFDAKYNARKTIKNILKKFQNIK